MHARLGQFFNSAVWYKAGSEACATFRISGFEKPECIVQGVMQQILDWMRCSIKQSSVKGSASFFLYVLGILVDFTRTKFQNPSSSELR
jgi:hypothetical protein